METKTIDLIKKLGTVTQFEKNQTLFMQNDVGTCMYIVLRGVFGVYVNSFTGFPNRVSAITAGNFFGEMSVIDNSPRSASIISESDDGTAIIIEKEKFALLLLKCPDIAEKILNTLSARICTTMEVLRKNGSEVPELSEDLKSPKLGAPKENLSLMKKLSLMLRELNAKVSADDEVIRKIHQTPSKTNVKTGLIELLREGFDPPPTPDKNDSSSFLQTHRAICPYCSKQQSIYMPSFSHLKVKESQLDQRIIYDKFDILWYTNIVCNNCNYTDSYQEFSKSGIALKNLKITENSFKNIEDFTGYANPANRNLREVILSYYLGIECIKRTSKNPLELAKSQLRLYWLYSDIGEDKIKTKYAMETKNTYISYLETVNDRISPNNRIRINAILGELSLTLGQPDHATIYFEEIEALAKRFNLENDDFLRQCEQRSASIKI